MSFELENWMTDLFPVIRSHPLTKLFIPGSHDSPMTQECLTQPSWPYNIPTALGPDASDSVKNYLLLGHSLVNFRTRVFIRNWAVTQQLSLGEQLRAGVRYFDLRIAKINGSFKFTHALQSHHDIATILAPVKDFMDNHPGEVLILHCQHFYEVMKGEYDHVLAVFQSLFGNMLSPRADIHDVQFDNYISSGRRVLLIWRGEAANNLTNPHLVYDEGEVLNGNWPQGVRTLDGLLEYTTRSQGDRPHPDPKLSVIQGILDIEDLSNITFATSSLLEYEKDVNGYLAKQLVPGLRTDRGFIYMLDNVTNLTSSAPNVVAPE
ncbi:hypothetical protein RhiJN_20301 [Ceratobasidium sp. AG-Ba]|nr:hypothetical protein RhiJN_20301 [Ceratobasidium sp. AG-Ba]